MCQLSFKLLSNFVSSQKKTKSFSRMKYSFFFHFLPVVSSLIFKFFSYNPLHNEILLGRSTTWMLDSDVMTFSVLYEDLNFTQPVVMSFQSKREVLSQLFHLF